MSGFLVLAALVWALGSVLPPFLIGAAVGFFLDPVCDRLEARGLSRGTAAALLILGFVLIAAGALALLLPFLWEQAAELADALPDSRAEAMAMVQPYLARLKPLLDAQGAAKIEDYLSSSASTATQAAGTLARGAISGGGALAGLLSVALITPLAAFYMLKDWDRIVAWCDAQIPYRHRDTVRRVGHDIHDSLAAWLRGQSLVCLSLAFYYAVGLGASGIRFGVLIGLLTGLVAFIPFAGFLAGLSAAVISGLLTLNGWGGWAVLTGVFVFGQALEGSVLTPRLVGRSVGLHEVWVIFAVMAGGHVLGLVGVLAALPAAAVLAVLLREGLARYRASDFFAGG